MIVSDYLLQYVGYGSRGEMSADYYEMYCDAMRRMQHAKIRIGGRYHGQRNERGQNRLGSSRRGSHAENVFDSAQSGRGAGTSAGRTA